VRDLEQYGYYPVVLCDCVVSSSPKLHEAAMLLMSARYDVITSQELLKIWHATEARKA
jgi:nicotinamidase-related amidase